MTTQLTGNETVKEVILEYIRQNVDNEADVQGIFNKFLSENRNYIERVLERKCSEKWGHCQISFMILKSMSNGLSISY